MRFQILFFSLLGTLLCAESLKVENFKINYLDSFIWETEGTVVIIQGDENNLSLEGPEDAIRDTSISARGGTLHIEGGKHLRKHSSDDLFCTLTVKDLTKLEFREHAVVKIPSLKVDLLEVTLKGHTQLTMGLEAKHLNMIVSGFANVTLSGIVEQQNVEVQGAGHYDAEKLASQVTDVRNLGASLVEVSASERVSIYNVGAGDVIYFGNPGKVEQKNLGAGAIKRGDVH